MVKEIKTMRSRTIMTKVGTIDFASIEVLQDSIELFVPVISVSDRLKEAIEENIQKEKAAYQKEILDSRGLKWSDADVNMEDQSLHIMINGKKLSYELTFSFSDKENKSFETVFSIPVEFPEYENEIKKIVLQTIVDKFF